MSKPLAMLIVTVFSLNVMIGLGVHCHFTDQTSITENMFYAYRPGMWRQTTMTDFQSGAFDGTEVRSPGSVTLSSGMAGDPVPMIYALVGQGSKHLYQYSIQDDAWTRGPDAPGELSPGGDVVSDGDRYLYVLQGGGSSTFWRFDAYQGTWSVMRSTPGPVNAGSDMFYSDGIIYALQGGGSKAVWSYDVQRNEWAEVPVERTYAMGPGSSIVVGGSRLYVLRPDSPNLISVSKSGGRWSDSFYTPPGTIVGPGSDMVVTPAKGSGKPLIFALFGGGTNVFQANSVESNGKWIAYASPPSPIASGGGLIHVGGASGHMYALAGGSSDGFYRWTYTQGMKKPGPAWSTLSSIPENVGDGGGLAFANGRLASGHLDGYYTSSVFDSGKEREVLDSIVYDVTLPTSGQDVTMYVRASDDAASISAMPWTMLPASILVSAGSGDYTLYADLHGIIGRYVQYMFHMQTVDPATAPFLHEVRLYHMAV